jgi:AcrR family transcriptional regulator
MPRPRFAKLPREKQEGILEAAAREFAEKGYENASLNQILLNAGLSKGAAYYYFDDKADVFITAVSYYSELVMRNVVIDFDTLTADNFWLILADVYRQQFQQAKERPWVFGAIKSIGSLPADMLSQEPFASFVAAMQSMLQQVLGSGQSLGVVRIDLPIDLLYALVMAIDDAFDQWMLPQWSDITDDRIETAVSQIIRLLQRLLSPT